MAPNLFVLFIASILVWLMFGVLGYMWYVDGSIKKEQVMHALLVVAVAWIASQIIKTIAPLPRPYMLNGQNPLTLTTPGDGAFPSAHSAIAFSLATSIWLHNKKYGWPLLVMAVLVGAGRILSYVHFPLDVLAGSIIGVVTAVVLEKKHLTT